MTDKKLQARASSPIVRLFCETRYLRVIGRRAFPVFEADLSYGQKAYIRSAYDFDASTMQEVYFNGIYEEGGLLKPGDTVIDVGAHIGSFTLRVAREVGPGGLVVDIEAASENFGLLSKNVKVNHLTNVRLFNVAAGSQEGGKAELKLARRRGQNSLYGESTDAIGTETVPVRTVDSIARELDLERVDFMKIDVEGAELEVLKGASETLRKNTPAIAMETHDFGPSEAELTSLLESFGYSVKTMPYNTARLGLLYAR